MSITTILIIYAVGVLINALIAAAIYDDMTEDKVLERIRAAVLLLYVFASFLTWVFALFYLLVWLVRRTYRYMRRDDGEKD